MSHTNARLNSSDMCDLQIKQSYLFQWNLNVGKVNARLQNQCFGLVLQFTDISAHSRKLPVAFPAL